MFEINLPAKDFADLILKSDSALYSMIGVGAFVMTTLGSALLRCAIHRRRQKSKARQFQKEVQAIARATTQDLITKNNRSVSTSTDVPLDEENPVELFEVVTIDPPAAVIGIDETGPPRLKRSQSVESVEREREW